MQSWNLKELNHKLTAIEVANDMAIKRKAELAEKIGENRRRTEELEEGLVLIQEAAKRTQNKVKDRFETIVQSCIDVVFPGVYEFKFEFVSRRNKTECDIYLVKNGVRYDPLDSNGGGVVDIISLALRVACLTISGKDKVLLLDEPTSHMRGEARKKMGEILNALSRNLGIQIVMVADVGEASVKPDRQFLVTNNNSVSTVTEMDLSER